MPWNSILLTDICLACRQALLGHDDTEYLFATENNFYHSETLHMIIQQLFALGKLTNPGVNFASVHVSDTCNCSHEFFVALGQLREAGYPLYNTG